MPSWALSITISVFVLTGKSSSSWRETSLFSWRSRDFETRLNNSLYTEPEIRNASICKWKTKWNHKKPIHTRIQTCYQDLWKNLETKTLATRSRDQDQDLGHQVSRPRPRPWPPGLETKTKTLATRSRSKTKTLVIRSRDQNFIIGHKYLCMCVYMYVCLYECMCVCYTHNVCMYICIYACRCISSQSYLS